MAIAHPVISTLPDDGTDVMGMVTRPEAPPGNDGMSRIYATFDFLECCAVGEAAFPHLQRKECVMKIVDASDLKKIAGGMQQPPAGPSSPIQIPTGPGPYNPVPTGGTDQGGQA